VAVRAATLGRLRGERTGVEVETGDEIGKEAAQKAVDDMNYEQLRSEAEEAGVADDGDDETEDDDNEEDEDEESATRDTANGKADSGDDDAPAQLGALGEASLEEAVEGGDLPDTAAARRGFRRGWAHVIADALVVVEGDEPIAPPSARRSARPPAAPARSRTPSPRSRGTRR